MEKINTCLLDNNKQKRFPVKAVLLFMLISIFFRSLSVSGQTYPGGIWQPGAAQYGSEIVNDVPVTMDDGVVLRASIAYPTDLATGKRAAGKFPVIIEHTPYVTLGQPIGPITYLTEHGYIYAVVRVRGMGTSGGDVQFFSARDGQDGKALVDWAAHRLEGSDGRIALAGCSYPGGMAFTDAAYIGPNSPVKAVIAASMGLGSLNRESFMVGGLPTTGFWNYTVNGLKLWGSSPSGKHFMDTFTTEVKAGGDAAYDKDFWYDRRQMWLAQKVVDNGIPLLLWSGWKDIIETGAVKAYTALQNAYTKRPKGAAMKPGQQATGRYQLIIGDWPHAVGLDVGVYLQWLETWVKGVNTGIQATKTPMHLFETGTKRWVNLGSYPIVLAYTSLYLSQGRLDKIKSKEEGNSKLIWAEPSQQDAKLSFTTAIFEQGATIAGPVSATVYASSSNTNLELIARLYDIGPDDSATLVTKGAILGSQRKLDNDNSWTDSEGVVTWPWPILKKDEYLTPDKVYKLEVSLTPRQAAGILPGHRLRLELTSQSPADIAPAEGVPPQNGTDPCRLTAPQQATVPGGIYKILYGSDWSSALNLPLLPYKALPEVKSGELPTSWSENQRRIIDSGFTLPLDWGSGK